MATKLFLRNTTLSGISNYYDMVTTAGAASATCVVNTAASGTEIQWTQTAGGATAAWITGQAPSGGFTLTTTDISIWAHESNMNANCGGRYRVFIRTAAGVETEIGGGPFSDGVEFGTAAAEMLWAGNVTDQAFAENDRILLKVYITDVGTMASGHTCTLTFNAADASTGDSFFNIAETVAFKPEAQTLTPSLFTNSNTFSAPTVASTYALAPTLYSDTDTVYSATVAATYSLTPSLYDDGDTFYTQVVSTTYTLTLALYDDGDTFYTHVVGQGDQALTPALYVDDDTFYTPAVASTYELTPALYSDTDTFLAHAASATYVLTPALYNDADGFYSHIVVTTYSLATSLYSDSDTFYAHTVAATYGIAPSLYSDADTFYAPTVQSVYALQPGLYVDADTFYTAMVQGAGGGASGAGLYTTGLSGLSFATWWPTLPFTFTKQVSGPTSLGRATETNVVPTVRAVRLVPVGRAEESDVARPISHIRFFVLGRAEEINVANPTVATKPGLGLVTRYVTVEMDEAGGAKRKNFYRDTVEHSSYKDSIMFTSKSATDEIYYQTHRDSIFHTSSL